MIKYVFCIWMFLGFKHNMCLRGGMFSLFDFVFFAGCVFIGASSSIVKADNSFEKEKLKVEEATGKFEK